MFTLIKVMIALPILVSSSLWSISVIESVAQDRCYGPAVSEVNPCNILSK